MLANWVFERDAGPEHRLQPLVDLLRFRLFDRIIVGAELPVDAPDRVRLLVHERNVALVEGRIEPEHALRRKVERHLHVADHEVLDELVTLERNAEQAAHARAHAVAGDHPIGLERVAALRGFDREAGAVRFLLDADDAVRPAQIDVREFAGAIDQDRFDVVLRQAQEGLVFLIALGREIERIEQLVLDQRVAPRPRNSLRDHALGDPEPRRDLHGTLALRDRAAAEAHRVVVVKQHAGNSAHAEIGRRREPGKPATDDDDAVMPDPVLGELGRRAERIDRIFEIARPEVAARTVAQSRNLGAIFRVGRVLRHPGFFRAVLTYQLCVDPTNGLCGPSRNADDARVTCACDTIIAVSNVGAAPEDPKGDGRAKRRSMRPICAIPRTSHCM